MSKFKEILSKLGFGKKKEEEATPDEAAAKRNVSAPKRSTFSRPSGASKSSSGDMEMVDVVAKLEDMASNNDEKLNWKTSIVDIMKLLDLDSSLDSRKELATELGISDHDMADSARMNSWLHKTVLQKLAENGGNVPKELLD